MTALAPFTPSRSDGRSDQQVVYELVSGNDPDTVFTYRQIRDALANGIDGEILDGRLYTAVRMANKRLLRNDQRFLRNVRGTGYRVITAAEHHGVALEKKDKALMQMRQGAEVLLSVRAEELTPAELQLARGTGMVFQGIVSAMGESKRRHERQEGLIDELRQRVERLEGPN